MSLASINLWLAMGWNVLQVMRIIWSQKESSHGWGFLALGKEICLVLLNQKESHYLLHWRKRKYESIATVGESRVWWRADFQSGSRVLKKVF